VARRWLGVLAVVVAVVAAAAVAFVAHRDGGKPSPEPVQAQPSQQVGDTADLMRRLERKKLVGGSR
jgi:hypothetical protein